ncbi:LysM peptidoglycan-binding domain-containing protein [Roseivirga sp. BDSF3-8]|uniref:LysM peptidoglycan-binding domain-containing protein n=1 Tax=Roseivirga sp. BDSF3-8 TaxID=3241598 RepID=UPI003532682D
MANNLLKISIFIALLLGNVISVFAGEIIERDSIRLEKDGVRSFILHKVDAGETLFSIARRYDAPMSDVIRANPSAESGLQVGQLLRVPFVLSKPQDPTRATHIVQPGETLFSISQKYNVSITDLRDWNNIIDNSIQVGGRLYVNGKPGYVTPENPAARESGPSYVVKNQDQPESVISRQYRKYHVVKEKETLYGLSRMYNVPVGDLRRWNSLVNNDVQIGQRLVVGSSAEDSPGTFTEPEDLPPPTDATEEVVVVASPDYDERDPTETPARPNADRRLPDENAYGERPQPKQPEVDDPERKRDFSKRSENGFAEVIEGSGDSKKYLALHRTAPIGTIMQIRNEMNSMSVFVRVVGRLPDTGQNRNTLIKISQTAYERLGAINSRFPVEVTYTP